MRAPASVVTLAFALVALVALAPSPAAQDSAPVRIVSSCTTTCHGLESTELAGSVHREVLDCIACHGGDPSAARDEQASHAASAGFIGVPARADVPKLCADCHADPRRMRAFGLPTDQLAHYETSNHGMALAAGDTSVAVCSDCHGAHGILPATDPRAPTAPRNQPKTCGRCHADATLMGAHDLPSDVVDLFSASVHGQALLVEQSRGAPSCADCHGSHGAAPPGVADIVQVCGHCHQSTSEQYKASPHGSADMSCVGCHDDREGQPGFLRAGCAVCHGAHEAAVAGPWLMQGDEPGRCAHCHRTDDSAAAVIHVVEDGTERLRAAMAETEDEIQRGKDKGLFLAHEDVYVRESLRALVSIGPLSHSLDSRSIAAHFEDGVKRQDRAREMISRQRDVSRDRMLLSSGLALSLLMLCGILWLKLGAVRRLS
ncbi:MAG: hypothetical protein H6825_11265 [Planctomycetes bacterium]|nr:hypothetical protein [Planctomycetota bacterium]